MESEKRIYKRDWVMTQEAFDKLLAWLDSNRDCAGALYVEIRRKLVSFFSRNGCFMADELADETISRVARRIIEEEKIANERPEIYCIRWARLVLHEYWRGVGSKQVPLDDSLLEKPNEDQVTEQHLQEQMDNCLQKCLDGLPPETRDLFRRYNQGAEREKINNRRKLAEHLNITNNALSLRANRIRSNLETCVKNCLANATK